MANTQDLQSILAQIGDTVRQVPITVVGAVQKTVLPILENVQRSIEMELLDVKIMIQVERDVNFECMERARELAAWYFYTRGGHISSDNKKLYKALTNNDFAERRKLPDGRWEYKLTLKKGDAYYGDIVNIGHNFVIKAKNVKYLKYISYRTGGDTRYAKQVVWWTKAGGFLSDAFEYYSRPDVVEGVRQEIYQEYQNGTRNIEEYAD